MINTYLNGFPPTIRGNDKTIIGNKKGYLLPMVIIYMVTAMIVGTGIVLLGSLDRIEANKRLHREQAFYLAEAGINYARYQLNTNGSSWVPPTNPYILQLAGATGTDSFFVDNITSDTMIIVTSTGTVHGVQERVQLSFLSALSAASPYNPSVPVGSYPGTIAITPDTEGSYIYVSIFSGPAGWGTGTTIKVIKKSDGVVIKTITVGSGPGGMVFSPPNGSYAYMYVTNGTANTVSVIRTSDNTVIQTISVGNYPANLAITPDGNYVYVANYNSDNVSVIQTSTNTVVKTISVGNGDLAVAANPNGNYVYAANTAGNSVSVIRTSDNTVIKTITVGNSPNDLKVTPDGNYVYVANTGGNTVSVIRTSDNTVIKTISVAPGTAPVADAITPDGKYVYVTNHDSNNVSIIQTSDNTVIGTPISIAPGTLPQDIAVSPDGNWVYGTNSGSTTIFVIRRSAGQWTSMEAGQWTKPDWKK